VALIKLRGWQLMLVKLIALPILRKVVIATKAKAAETPNDWDDILGNAFEVVINFLESPEAFEET